MEASYLFGKHYGLFANIMGSKVDIRGFTIGVSPNISGAHLTLGLNAVLQGLETGIIPFTSVSIPFLNTYERSSVPVSKNLITKFLVGTNIFFPGAKVNFPEYSPAHTFDYGLEFFFQKWKVGIEYRKSNWVQIKGEVPSFRRVYGSDTLRVSGTPFQEHWEHSYLGINKYFGVTKRTDLLVNLSYVFIKKDAAMPQMYFPVLIEPSHGISTSVGVSMASSVQIELRNDWYIKSNERTGFDFSRLKLGLIYKLPNL